MAAPTEKSYLWTTGGAGDGASTVSRSDWARIVQIVGACNGYQGVGAGYANKLAGTAGTNKVTFNTGVAIVDGHPYECTVGGDMTIDSAVGGGNTRIDRVVLRAGWTAQTVRLTVIKGTDAASPTVPTVTTTSGTTYDILLYQALVNTSGAVTLTDERDYADEAVRDGSVTSAMLRNSTGLSVIGRSANTTGVPADIVGTDGQVFRVSGTTLEFGTIATAGIADDAVDDTKIGNRVMRLYRRQGGSASTWAAAGSTDYTPTTVKTEMGATSITIANGMDNGSSAITFPTAFTNSPLVFHSLISPNTNVVENINVSGIGTTGCTINVNLTTTSHPELTFVINWQAHGAE